LQEKLALPNHISAILSQSHYKSPTHAKKQKQNNLLLAHSNKFKSKPAQKKTNSYILTKAGKI